MRRMEQKYHFVCTPRFIGSPNGAFKIGLLFLAILFTFESAVGLHEDFISLLSFPPTTVDGSMGELLNISRHKREDSSCDHAANKYLCLPLSYSKFELPHIDTVNVVEIGIDISDVLRINDKEYSVTFSSYFNVLWQEPRLRISERFLKELNHSVTTPDTMIPVNLELVNDLWLPNIFIYNLKTFKVVEVLSKHAGLWITTNNDVFYSQATHITFICPMRFDSFPLDTQRCKFQVGSYSYDDTKMIFLESPRVKGYVETSRSIVLDYDVKITPLKQIDRILSYGSLGNYSLAGFEMILHRYVSHYIITYYLPSGLFVVVSWISFVVPPDVIPGRMALLITLFLVLVNIFNSVTTNTPKAEGLTAIEAWMLACILFVFGALVEYAVILFRRQTSKDDEAPRIRVKRLPNYNNSQASAQRVKLICKDNSKYEVDLQAAQQTAQQLSSVLTHSVAADVPQSVSLANANPTVLSGNKASPPPPPPRSLNKTNNAKHAGSNGQDGTPSGKHMTSVHGPMSSMQRYPQSGSVGLPSGHHHHHHHHYHHYHPGHHNQQPQQQLILHNPGYGQVTTSTVPSVPPHHPQYQNYLHQQAASLQGQPLNHDDGGAENGPDYEALSQVKLTWNQRICGENYIHVDRFFLVAMPFLFLVFNVVYWLSYGSHFFMEQASDDENLEVY